MLERWVRILREQGNTLRAVAREAGVPVNATRTDMANDLAGLPRLE